MQQLERIKPIAQRLLTLQLESKRRDAWLWERALRVSRLTQLIGHAPELAGRGIDLLAAGARFVSLRPAGPRSSRAASGGGSCWLGRPQISNVSWERHY